MYNSKQHKLNKKEINERTFASSAGQLKSSIDDLIKFPKLLSKKSLEILTKIYFFTIESSNYIVTHLGGILGGKSGFEFVYDDKWKIIKIKMKLETIY